MIEDTTIFDALSLKPPALERREVIFYAGVSVRSGTGRRLLALSETWQAEHLPYRVAVPGDKFHRAKMRLWMNRNLFGMWCFADFGDDQPGINGVIGVRFSDETEASAFKIFWC
ncbi:hypothetical protein EON82_23240 [bacterium]|nr:MAG: hypothetical protein EON82_23240 [bacterium]